MGPVGALIRVVTSKSISGEARGTFAREGANGVRAVGIAVAGVGSKGALIHIIANGSTATIARIAGASE